MQRFMTSATGEDAIKGNLNKLLAGTFEKFSSVMGVLVFHQVMSLGFVTISDRAATQHQLSDLSE